ncbi:multicopper oxidase [Wolfiporia cocos MD-104 SS10]|uniref:laccase n=1 Tax=Wolfiporia cocos (strain MD-104) TaxID=742152 RepID=A0A2H3JKI8_WOLCO|nr:multicopper oxidase [Wolfiporia cocos MD-104 SS10]
MTARRLLFSLATLFLPYATLASSGPRTELHIVNREIAPDGFYRQTVLANGTFPGPIISGEKGDRFEINVHDHLTDSTMNKTTSIHWHGIYQHHTNWADGPEFVTQCPISPGHSFLYNFTVSTQAGTFWYHSHEGVQYCDGLRGPLIIYDPDDPHAHLYDVDDDSTVITLADWYHKPAIELTVPQFSQSILINGLGRGANDTTSPLSVITVQQGLRYRMRLVSISCDPYFNFTIDGHNMTIIEADGSNTEPFPGVDEIQIFAAQRYSFILDANQPIGNYWIRAAPEDTNQRAPVPPPGLAILRYVGAPDEEPETKSYPAINSLVETSLHALEPNVPGKPYPGGADMNFPLNFSFNDTKFYVNNASWESPPVPVLLQILHGEHTPQELLPHGSIIELPRNKTIEINMPGGLLNIPHPIHLHGHSFYVVRSAGNSSYNYENPVLRDTVSIGSSTTDNVTIRFDTNNPGPWFLHCHIDFHLAAGFAVVMAEDIAGTPAADRPPVAWDDLCAIYDKLPVSDH